MTNYAVKEGYDQALIDLVDIDPQPHSNGVEYTVRDDAIDGGVSEQGPFVELIFDALATVTEYTALLALFGLDSANTAEVTIYCPGPLYTFARYNGIAKRPEKGKDQHREILFRDIHIIIRDLEASA